MFLFFKYLFLQMYRGGLIYLGVAPVPTPSRNEKSDWDGGGRTGAPIESRLVVPGFWFLRSCIAALRSSISSTLISISKRQKKKKKILYYLKN